MRSVILFLATAGLLFAQLSNNTLTVQASRTVNQRPDQVVFEVDVTSGTDAILDDIVAALDGTGITADNFAGVSRGSSDKSVRWTFLLAVPFAKIADTISSLTAAQSNAITFQIAGTQVSPDAQAAQQCKETDLVADASAQVKKLAAAAGYKVGPILAVSNVNPGLNIAIPTALLGAVIYDPSVGISFPGNIIPAFRISPYFSLAPPQLLHCSLTVQFALQP